MPYGTDNNGKDYAQCPCCAAIAHGIVNIEQEFGYRNMENGKTIPQSYCRKCRAAGCKAGQPCKVK